LAFGWATLSSLKHRRRSRFSVSTKLIGLWLGHTFKFKASPPVALLSFDSVNWPLPGPDFKVESIAAGGAFKFLLS